MPTPDASFASSYLTSQGWVPGSALQKGGLKKPITVAHKTNLKGIGKERDTGYAWWDDVFSMVANKGKGKASEDLRKTSTGIYSPLPPNGSSPSAQVSGSSTPVASTSNASNGIFNTDIIGQAKLEAARREFYAKFLRGKPLAGSVDEEGKKVTVAVEAESSSASENEAQQAEVEEKSRKKLEKEERRRSRREKRDRKELKRQKKEEKQKLIAVTSAALGQAEQLLPLEAAPKAKKAKKRKRDSTAAESLEVASKAETMAAASSLPTPPPTDGEVEEDEASVRKAAKRARKEERRRKKVEQASV